jgi:signal transduction histidine kinase
MNAATNVLFVSASAADELVLSTLLARDLPEPTVRVFAAATAQRFYDALYSERSFQVIALDQRQDWSRWQDLVASCNQQRPDAVLVLLADDTGADAMQRQLQDGVAAVYPRDSAGLVALARLVSKITVQGGAFSLRQGDEAEAETAPNGEERERLVYAVSHDLQDPLQLARRYADMLNEDYQASLGESGSKVLGHLQFNLTRTQEMLDELLDFSRLQSAEPDRQPVDFNELLDETIDLYRVTLDDIGGTVSKEQDLPILMVDRRQFQRVFQNLIGNAIKFRSEAPLEISVRAQRVRDEWRIGIKDNGIGISEQDSERIFGMFERGGASDEYPGTGMGLAICKRIISNHGGKIWVRSSPGGGSAFIFSVPSTDEPRDLLGD